VQASLSLPDFHRVIARPSAAEGRAIGVTLVLVVVLCLGEGAECVVPVGFEGIGDQPVGGIDVQIPLTRQVGRVLNALDLEAAEPIGILAPLSVRLDNLELSPHPK
jgi:hypothetical protein